MTFNVNLEPNSTIARDSIEIEGGLTYNADQVAIEGVYSDELSQHRAKRAWCTILETDFLLIPGTDFQFQIQNSVEKKEFQIACSFKSACGRYAFWRLINEQAPEVQFLLETAHMSHRFQDYSSIIDQLELAGDKRKGKTLFNSIRSLLADAASQLRELAKRR